MLGFISFSFASLASLLIDYFIKYRPEYVKKSVVPLSSDAFSGFGVHEKEAHNAEVLAHTNALYEQVRACSLLIHNKFKT